jgi:LPS export ABC transporter protein LptC
MNKKLNFKFCAFVFIIPILSFFHLLISGCTKKESIPQASDTLVTPCQEVGASTLYAYDGPHLIWILDSDYSFKTLEDTSSMLVVPVRMSIFDTLGSKTTRVLADSGITKKELVEFFVWGNVYIKNYDDQIIRSETLWWNKTTRKVGSDDFVEITTPEGDVLRGKGLDATETFSSWSLRENVSGEFPNFKERMDSDEEF